MSALLPDPSGPPILARIPIDPAEAETGLLRLVLTLVEFVRRLMEAQAMRRFEAGALTPEQEEHLGAALAACEQTILSLCARHGIPPEDLTLDLGPLGRLM
jgi:hypothetical protein